MLISNWTNCKAGNLEMVIRVPNLDRVIGPSKRRLTCRSGSKSRADKQGTCSYDFVTHAKKDDVNCSGLKIVGGRFQSVLQRPWGDGLARIVGKQINIKKVIECRIRSASSKGGKSILERIWALLYLLHFCYYTIQINHSLVAPPIRSESKCHGNIIILRSSSNIQPSPKAIRPGGKV